MSDDLDALFRDLDDALRALGARCDACGRCCHFDEMEHVLYASEWEADRLVSRAGPTGNAPEGRCPYQQGDACAARDGRPLGCRLHFCDSRPGIQAELERLSSEMHEALKRLHDRHGRAWRYAPLLATLRDRAARSSRLPDA